jgi:hypothetical protein
LICSKSGGSSTADRGHLTDAQSKSPGEPPKKRNALLASYVAAAVIGGGLGASGLLPLRDLLPTSSTPLARVGYALREPAPKASPRDWAALREDIDAVRSAWSSEEPAVFELVVAVRGLYDGGNSDFKRAAELCRALKWPHCDQRALDVMKERSRP